MADSKEIHFQKPDTIDTPIYEKPNAYDDDEIEQHQPTTETVEELIISCESLNLIVDHPDPTTEHSPSEPEPASPPPVYDAEKSPTLTSTLLSRASSTTQTTYAEDTTPVHIPLSPSTSMASTSSSSNSGSFKLLLMNSLKKRPKEDMNIFEIRKLSLTKPHLHDIYYGGTKKLAYSKDQLHSYSWGFQNVLYRISDAGHRSKVAEARRRAFQKEITLEWGDYLTDDINSGGLENKTKSHLTFLYETQFDQCRLRWKRPSLLSHDMVCELRDHKQQRIVAEFDSHGKGYLIQLGRLVIDRQALNEAEHPDQMEAHLVVTCCTLVDLMREVVEKAVGLGNGGVAGSG
ncbi:hypothetical protein DFQ28_009203 [Apophysomyces sp. BC1034]|nr:hypothetical protein DFQ30_008897 [Apophysomyces sp. BC1015]KAG0173607.1 hypothetical protein DFQ29_007895 [Apophysomyces sp. BC1021]KAG0185527.1 hypothetical protein DFQ28_009203 [Apophysomyces sp. BC1034]